MNSWRFRLRSPARSQRGFALIAILALAALIAAFLISSGLSRSNADVSNDREQRTMDSLRQAKAALIAYAAAADWQLQTASGSYLQPGALPCPDSTGDGISDCAAGSVTNSVIGRLPWKTMHIDDLRDASGEQIWIAISHDFRKMQCVSPPGTVSPLPNGCTRINSDTKGQLGVTGAMSASNVVAVLIAPGIALQGQTRPNSTPSNYLESYAPGDGIHYTFTTNAIPDQVNNDRIVVITQAELMNAVEPVVAARLERDIAPLIQAYNTRWGAYPFPAPFGDPSRQQTAYVGTTGTITKGGWLPVTTDPTFLTWTFSSTYPLILTQIPGGSGNGTSGPTSPSHCRYTWAGGGGGTETFSNSDSNCTLDSVDCRDNSGANAIVCEIRYSGGGDDRPAISIQAVLRNAAFSFPAAFTPRSPTMTNDNNAPLLVDNVDTPVNTNPNNTGQWSWSKPPENLVPFFFLPTIAYNATPNNDGSAYVTFSGRLQNAGSIGSGGTGGRVTITITPPGYDTITSGDGGANPETAWFVANEWFRQTYYAVAPRLLPGGGGTCTNSSTPPCLRVNNLRPAKASPNDNKLAVLVLAGRSLTGVNRPIADPTAYFENANLTAANAAPPYVYENRIGAPTSINDRVVVIAP